MTTELPSNRPSWGLDAARLRRALGHFPTGVAVATAAAQGKRVGLTVSSFNSVSLDPPLILWSITRSTPSFPVFLAAETFCINILAEGQRALAEHFARSHPDKFEAIDYSPHATAAPVLAGCAAHLVCRTWNRYDGGDHLIIIGEVIDLGTAESLPLVFAFGRYRKLAGESGTVEEPRP